MKYTVEEVRNAARLLDGLSRRMLTDYADRIEAAQSEDWRIGFFERWREAAHEKGYAGIAEAITAAPVAPSPGEDVVLAAIAANPGDVADQFDEPVAQINRLNMLEDTLFQISVRLGEAREPDMDDMHLHPTR